MSHLAHFGRFPDFWLILFLTSNFFSIVMEFADDGDVYQRLTDCQAKKVYMKEKHVWKILI